MTNTFFVTMHVISVLMTLLVWLIENEEEQISRRISKNKCVTVTKLEKQFRRKT